jgi:diguanylate cyclase (GGDEF)-like protein
MDNRLTRDERFYVFCRMLLLCGLSALVYFGVLKLPLDRDSFILLSAIWIMLSTVALLWPPLFIAFLIFLMHAIDIFLIGYLVWNNGGNSCPAAYLLPLYVITIALFVGKAYAVVTTCLITAFFLYLTFNEQQAPWIYFGFWTSYSAGVLCFSFYLTAVKDVRHFKVLYEETEKREKFLERNLTKLEQKINTQSIIDEATGLKNFRYFRERIDTEIKRAARQKYIFSLCIVSVDGLEEFRNRTDASERDKVLARITRQLEKSLRDTDLLSRFQSDQFVFLLPDTDPRQALIPSKRIRDKLLAIGFGIGGADKFNFSFGIAGFPMDAQNVGGLLSLASAALQRSHERGQSQLTLASSVSRYLI